MKKFLFFAVAAAMTLSFVSCQKEDKKGGNDDEGGFKKEYRVKTFGDNWGSPYTLTYNADGKIASVVSKGDNRVCTYSGNTCTVTNGDAVEYTLTLNKDGFITKAVNTEHTWNITYDADGILLKVLRDGEETTSQLNEDGNVTYWTRWDADNNFWRMKKHSYLDKKNLGGIHTHYSEDAKLSRWMFEAGLLGNSTVNLVEACRWWDFGDVPAEKTAVYEYEYDANGCVTKEIKWYGVWNETDLQGLEEDTVTSFTYEKI